MLLGILVLLVLRSFAILTIPPGGDEVLYLYMADDIAQGVRFPLYTYEQQVLGTLNSWSLVPFLKLFGLSWPGVRFYYGLFYLAFMGMYLWIARRLFSRELVNNLFVLLSILPFPMLFFTTIPCWMDVPFLAILSLLILVKMADQTSSQSVWPSLALGFVSGIGIWCNPLFVIWMVPAGISVMGLIPGKKIRPAIGFFLGFLAGLFPVWIHGLQTGTLMNLDRKGGSGFVSLEALPQALYLFFSRMKYALSTFSFGPISPLVDGLLRAFSWIPFLIFSFSFAFFFFDFLKTRRDQTLPRRIFYHFIIIPPVIFAVLYSSRNFSSTRDEGMRFFLQLLIPYSFAVAWQLERLKPEFLKKGLSGLLLGILLGGNLFSGWMLSRRGSELREVVRFLEREKLQFGIADMGIAYPLNVLSGHRIITTPLPHHAAARSIWEKVKAAGPRYLVLERENPQLRKELERDSNLKKDSVGSYDVFYGESDYLTSILDVQEPILG